MKIALICQFEQGTAEHVLTVGRSEALKAMGHATRLVEHPFKRGQGKPLPIVYLAATAFLRCLALRWWSPRVVFVQKLLPLGLIYVAFLRLMGLKTVAIADDWEGVGGFATLRNRGWFGLMLVTAAEEAMARLSTHLWAVSLPLAARWPRALYYPNGGRLSSMKPYQKPYLYRVCYVGTLKDPRVVEILSAIAKESQMWSMDLRIVGGGPLLHDMIERCAGMHSVSVLGQLPPVGAAEVMLGSHVGLLYLSHDSMMVDVSRSSTKLFEYMAAGCVPVCSAVGEPINIIEHGKTGLLVPENTPEAFCKAITRLMHEVGLYDVMSNAAQDLYHARYAHTVVMDRILRRVVP